MFYNNPKCIKLADGIFLFKNYLSEKKVNFINDKMKQIEIKEFKYEESLIDWYKEKISPPIYELHDIWEEISILLSPEYVMHPCIGMITTRPGDGGMFVHADSPGRDMEEDLSQIDTFKSCCIIDYGLVAYFGDFEGGEIFYPKFNKDGSLKDTGDSLNCLEYKPEAGDILIHRSIEPWHHGVREIKSGVRYAFSNFVLKSQENPGTFYNYGTKEYFNQIGDKTMEEIRIWKKPLFENSQNKITKNKVLNQFPKN